MTYQLFIVKGRMIANNIIDRDANGKSNSTINSFTIDLFGKEFLRLGCDDGVSEFTDINDLGSRNTLPNQPLEGNVNNFGSFLIFCANITVDTRNE